MAQDLGERLEGSVSASRGSNGYRPPDAGLWRAAYSAHASLPGCDGVGVCLVADVGGHPSVANLVDTSEMAHDMDWVQADRGDGPALAAIRQLQVFNVPDLWKPGPWPEFSLAAEALGARSGLFVPVIDGGRALGAMSFYSGKARAFAGRERLALSFSAEVAKALVSTLQSERGPGPELV